MAPRWGRASFGAGTDMRSQPYANSANGRGPPKARGTGNKGKDLGDPIRSGPGCAHNTHAPCRSGWLPPPTRRHFITGPVVQPFLLSKPPTQRLGKAGPMVQPSYSKPPTQRHLGIGPVMRPFTFSKPPTRRKTGGAVPNRLHGGEDPGALREVRRPSCSPATARETGTKRGLKSRHRRTRLAPYHARRTSTFMMCNILRSAYRIVHIKTI